MINSIYKVLENKVLESTYFESNVKKACISYFYFKYFSELEIKNKVEYLGVENLKQLPEKNVLFVSNYNSEVMDLSIIYKYLVLNDSSLLYPRLNLGFMISSDHPLSSSRKPVMEVIGGITCPVSGPENENEESESLELELCEDLKYDKMVNSLENGWLIDFPTRTTTMDPRVLHHCPKILKELRPVVVPVHIDGTRECFGTSGTSSFEPKEGCIRVTFKPPLEYDISEDDLVIAAQVSCAIKNS